MTLRSRFEIRIGVAAVIAASAGCASREARQGTVEVGAELAAVRQTTADLAAGVAAVRAEISAHTEATVAAVRDESRRGAETLQTALVASSRVDNSTHDRWESRLLAAGFVILALSYPVGKLVWIAAGWAARKKRQGPSG